METAVDKVAARAETIGERNERARLEFRREMDNRPITAKPNGFIRYKIGPKFSGGGRRIGYERTGAPEWFDKGSRTHVPLDPRAQKYANAVQASLLAPKNAQYAAAYLNAAH